MRLALMLYKAYIRPLITYAYPVWCTVSSSCLDKLERFQRIGLLKATGCLSSTATNSLDVLAGCIPLRLVLSEILAAEYVRIMRKPADSPIKASVIMALESQSHKSAPKLMKHAYGPTNKSIDVTRAEGEPIYHDQLWYPSVTHAVITQEDLGGSHSRTKEMSTRARELTSTYLQSLPRTSLVIFTDGSPGPCGSSAIVFTHGLAQEPVVLKRPISTKSSAFHGELSAIDLALEFACTFCYRPGNAYNTISIFTDCKSALQTVVNGVKTNFTSLVNSIQDSITSLDNHRISVELAWVAGHAGLRPNELADTAAKEAAVEASKWQRNHDISLKSFSEIKKEIRVNCLKVWQRRWERQEDGRFTFTTLPLVATSRRGTTLDRQTEIKFNRLRSGHSLLAKHAFKMKLPSHPTPLCSCGHARETIDHFLLHCSNYSVPRDNLIASIERKYQSAMVPYHLRTFDIPTLLGENPQFPMEVRLHIPSCVAVFIKETADKI